MFRFYAIKSIRQCVVCRTRMPQRDLVRFKYGETRLSLYDGYGRSFYACLACLVTPKAVVKIKRQLGIGETSFDELKEIVKTWQVDLQDSFRDSNGVAKTID